MVDYGADNLFGIPLVVANGASVCTAVEHRGMRPVGILVPITTTNTAVIQWWAGFNGSTPVVMRDMAGVEIETVILATEARYVPLGNTDDAGAGSDRFRGVNTTLIKLFQSDGSTAQAQGAERTFTLICERRPR